MSLCFQTDEIEDCSNYENSPKWNISESFQQKLDKCLKGSSDSWILSEIKKDIPLTDIGEKFMEYHEYDGNIYTDGASALFEAFISYRRKEKIPKQDAIYLRNRGGIVAQIWDKEKDDTVILTVLELINCFEQNDNFHKWISSI